MENVRTENRKRLSENFPGQLTLRGWAFDRTALRMLVSLRHLRPQYDQLQCATERITAKNRYKTTTKITEQKETEKISLLWKISGYLKKSKIKS